jgi:hypothetical protein
MNKYIGRSALVSITALVAVGAGFGANPAMAAPPAFTAPSVEVAYQAGHNHHVSKLPKTATEWQAAWNSADINALAALFTADGVYIDNGVGKTSVGTAQITNWKATTDYLIAGVHIDVISAHRHRNIVIVHSRELPTASPFPARPSSSCATARSPSTPTTTTARCSSLSPASPPTGPRAPDQPAPHRAFPAVGCSHHRIAP